jgi:hypothetical protein
MGTVFRPPKDLHDRRPCLVEQAQRIPSSFFVSEPLPPPCRPKRGYVPASGHPEKAHALIGSLLPGQESCTVCPVFSASFASPARALRSPGRPPSKRPFGVRRLVAAFFSARTAYPHSSQVNFRIAPRLRTTSEKRPLVALSSATEERSGTVATECATSGPSRRDGLPPQAGGITRGRRRRAGAAKRAGRTTLKNGAATIESQNRFLDPMRTGRKGGSRLWRGAHPDNLRQVAPASSPEGR